MTEDFAATTLGVSGDWLLPIKGIYANRMRLDNYTHYIDFALAYENMWLDWSPCLKFISYVSTTKTHCDYKGGIGLVECSNVVMDFTKYPDLTFGISDKYNLTMGPNEYAFAINSTAIRFNFQCGNSTDNSVGVGSMLLKKFVTTFYLDNLGYPRITIMHAPMSN